MEATATKMLECPGPELCERRISAIEEKVRDLAVENKALRDSIDAVQKLPVAIAGLTTQVAAMGRAIARLSHDVADAVTTSREATEESRHRSKALDDLARHFLVKNPTGEQPAVQDKATGGPR